MWAPQLSFLFNKTVKFCQSLPEQSALKDALKGQSHKWLSNYIIQTLSTLSVHFLKVKRCSSLFFFIWLCLFIMVLTQQQHWRQWWLQWRETIHYYIHGLHSFHSFLAIMWLNGTLAFSLQNAEPPFLLAGTLIRNRVHFGLALCFQRN